MAAAATPARPLSGRPVAAVPLVDVGQAPPPLPVTHGAGRGRANLPPRPSNKRERGGGGCLRSGWGAPTAERHASRRRLQSTVDGAIAGAAWKRTGL